MHILPIILSAWSYKNDVTERYLRSLDRGYIPDDKPDGQLTVVKGEQNAMSKFETDRIRARKKPASDPLRIVRTERGATNEISGSHFASNEIEHDGTDAWQSLKDRLAEHDIHIDDDKIAVLAAGFWAERKTQEFFGQNKQKLRDELLADAIDEYGEKRYDAAWVREIESHPDRDAIALECMEDLQMKFPKALTGVRVPDKAIGFDPNVVEIDREDDD